LHRLQFTLPAWLENVPCWHALQVVIIVAPVTVEYVPWMQFRQVALTGAPIVVEYVPDMQLRHATLDDKPDAVEYLPSMQDGHIVCALPNIVLYLPGAHRMHSLTELDPDLVR